VRTYSAAAPDGPWLVLAHGAGAGQDHPWMRRAAERLADLGVSVVTFDFPYTAAGRKLPDRGPVLEQAFSDVWTDVWRKLERTGLTGVGAIAPRVFAGGKSMGGRIASQVAARGGFTPPPSGLVFFGYPLHPPGRPLDRRDRHLPDVNRPMLFLHGTKDPFGEPDEMRALTGALPRATLALVEGGDHSLTVARSSHREASLDRVFAMAAAWMQGSEATTAR
jgi:predicted alpha/beta-hydrolase family hydrolase